jgi:drug/metabolite transporter (DMT)-like permease
MPLGVPSGLEGVFLGLASAASWGAGDFSGGLASRRGDVYDVVLVSQAVGLGLLVGLALLLVEPLPPAGDLLWAAGAGLAGGLGLLALYRGLALGRMGVVAPVAAVVSAALPALFGLWTEGLPSTLRLAGFGLALVAVWLVSRPEDGGPVRRQELTLPLLAGLGFGFFLIVVDRLSETAVLWPLAAARLASITMLAVTVLARQRPPLPVVRSLPLLLLVGLFDTAGNAFYALATRAGRLDVAAVLSSLYPAITVLLARSILREQVAARQWLGVAAALVAVVLIAS